MSTAIKAHKDPKLPPPIELSDGPDWTAVLSALDDHAAETLVAVMRTLCPHDSLPDRVYRRTVVAFDRLHNEIPESKTLIAELIQDLDARMPFRFKEAAEIYRIEMLRKVEDSAAFRFVQRTTVRYLYDDLEVWQAFGYEGASVHLGGYVERGFNDLDWLPDPPAGV